MGDRAPGGCGTVATVSVQPMVAPPEPSLVGRDRDVERLAALVSGIERGSRVIVVRGEAGNGKTVLWRGGGAGRRGGGAAPPRPRAGAGGGAPRKGGPGALFCRGARGGGAPGLGHQ